MNHNGDVILGVGGLVASFSIAQYNALLGAVGLTITVGVMCIRFRKEWKNRNDKPPIDP